MWFDQLGLVEPVLHLGAGLSYEFRTLPTEARSPTRRGNRRTLSRCTEGKLLVIDADATAVEKVIDLNAIPTPGATSPDMARSMGGPKAGLQPGASAMPQDVRLSPDGKWLMAADMLRNGVWVINADSVTYVHFIPTGLGAHGIYPSRDATRLYVSNHDEGSLSVLDAATLTASPWF